MSANRCGKTKYSHEKTEPLVKSHVDMRKPSHTSISTPEHARGSVHNVFVDCFECDARSFFFLAHGFDDMMGFTPVGVFISCNKTIL